MRPCSIDQSHPRGDLASFPLLIEQSASRSSPVLTLAVLVPVALALLTPFLLVAAELVSNPAARAVLAGKPALAAQLLSGLLFWAVLFGWPLKRIADLFQRGRSIEIDRDRITVTEIGLLGRETWIEPLSAYRGLEHKVRSSISGVRHELSLVHPDNTRSILIAIAPRFSDTEIAALDRHFRCAGTASRTAQRPLAAPQIAPESPVVATIAARA